MISLVSADKILRTVYLDAIAEEIKTNTTPFFSRIENTADYLYGKEIIAPCRIGINGGLACTSELAALPASGIGSYLNLKAQLCNIYGTVEFTDKVFRLSQGDTACAVNILTHEMESLLKSAKFNMSRMLFQNGKGILGTIDSHTTSTTTVLSVDSCKNFVEGMIVDIVNGSTVAATGLVITYVNRTDRTITVGSATNQNTPGYTIHVQGSYNSEIYGIPYIFDNTVPLIYGNVRTSTAYALPIQKTCSSVSNTALQEVLDTVDENFGSTPDLIIASYDMRRKYLEYLRTNSLNVDTKEIEAGFNSITYNGIPLYVEKFAPDNTMYFLNTDDYKMIQLGDWTWLEGNSNNVLNQVAGKAAYYATLVKYCNLLCTRPMAQAKLGYVAPTTTSADDE